MAFRDAKLLFITTVLFVLIFGLCLQLIVLPMTPWHVGNGLMAGGDWVRFHRLAVGLAELVRQEGWAGWDLRVEGQAPASIAAALYYLTGVQQPWVLLPLHGFLYAISAVALYSIILCFGVGQRFSLLLLLPLYVFPSTAMIWGQIHKDIYSIPGILLVLRFWVQVGRTYSLGSRLPVSALGVELFFLAMGMALIIFVRPYLGQVVLLASVVSAMFLLLRLSWSHYHLGGRSSSRPWNTLFFVLAGLSIQSAMISAAKAIPGAEGTPGAEVTIDSTVFRCQVWSPTKAMPKFIESRIERLACEREWFRQGYPGAGSNIDTDIGFEDLLGILSYIPRALQVSLFSPFPNLWFKGGIQPGGRFTRLLIIPEMLVLYGAILGILLGVIWSEARGVILMVFLFSLTLVIVHALVITNIGTLYRMRYPAMLIWIALGGIGWKVWFNRRKPLSSPESHFNLATTLSFKQHAP